MTQQERAKRQPGRVVVLGSINLDILVTAPRLPRAGETIAGDTIERELGGKGANQAVAATMAGAQCRLLGATGSDAEGAAMTAALARYGVDVTSVRKTQLPTGCALVATSTQDNQIITITGANAAVDETLARTVDLAEGDICLAQMETPAQATKALFEQARRSGARTILNAAPATADALALFPLCDLLIVNETELRLLAALPIEAPLTDAVLLACAHTLGLGGDQILIVTLGPDGLAIIEEREVARILGWPVAVTDTSGAGDCFCGYLAAAMARGDDVGRAAREANRAASLAVQALGAARSMPPRRAVFKSLAA